MFQDTEEIPEQNTNDVVNLGWQLNLEPDTTDVDEWIASHSEESLANKDLIGLQQSSAPLEDDKSDDWIEKSYLIFAGSEWAYIYDWARRCYCRKDFVGAQICWERFGML